MPKIDIKVGGSFQLIAIDSLTGESRIVADWFPNLITDPGMDVLGLHRDDGFNDYTYVEGCFIGEGNATPTYSDTQMDSLLNAKIYTWPRQSFTASPTAPYFGEIGYNYLFDVGSATGNISEIGVGWWTSYPDTYQLFSRTLIKNSSGLPIVITILETEALLVRYRFRMYPPVDDVSYKVTISGVEYDCVTRPWAVLSANHWAPQIDNRDKDCFAGTGSLSAQTDSWVSGTNRSEAEYLPYTLETHEHVFNAKWFGEVANHAGGITRVLTSGKYGAYQTSFSPPIAKESPLVLSLNFKFSWSRHE